MSKGTTTATASRNVTILVRYFVKTGANKGNIILLVENDKGDRYQVTLRRNGKHSCSCPHHPSKKSPTCYHMTHCREVENVRAAKENAAKRQAREETEIEALVTQLESESQLQRDQATLAHQLATQEAHIDLATQGQLNGDRAFSILRK
jgi:hypothetical protein